MNRGENARFCVIGISNSSLLELTSICFGGSRTCRRHGRLLWCVLQHFKLDILLGSRGSLWLIRVFSCPDGCRGRRRLGGHVVWKDWCCNMTVGVLRRINAMYVKWQVKVSSLNCPPLPTHGLECDSGQQLCKHGFLWGCAEPSMRMGCRLPSLLAFSTASIHTTLKNLKSA